MASENTHLLDDREENALIHPVESNENVQSSSISRTKVGIAALLGTIAIGALVAFNGRSEIMGLVSGNASSLKTANFAASSKDTSGKTLLTDPQQLKALVQGDAKTKAAKTAVSTKSNLRKQSRNKEV